MKFKSEYYWFLIFAICFFAFNQIQDNIRPHFSGKSVTIKYLLGVAPNFFPAIDIPALLVVLITHIFIKDKSDVWFLKRDLFRQTSFL
jgi:hypothetical protein